MKIRLQQFGPSDFADYSQLVGNAQAMAMITERAIPNTEARVQYAEILADNAFARELGHFRILKGERGDFVGLGKLRIDGVGCKQGELGYILSPEYWGLGIGTKVATMLIDRARQQKLESLFAIIDPANIPSRKILVNHGFASTSFQDFDGLPGEIMELQL